MTPAPERTLEQRFTALDRANRVRTARAELKRRMRDDRGLVAAVELLTDPVTFGARFAAELNNDPAYTRDAPPAGWALSWHIGDVLRSLPGYGRVKVNKALKRLDVSPAKTVGGLTVRQRATLVADLTYTRRARGITLDPGVTTNA